MNSTNGSHQEFQIYNSPIRFNTKFSTHIKAEGVIQEAQQIWSPHSGFYLGKSKNTTLRVAPWFGKEGMAIQHELPKLVKWYLDNGYLREKF